MVQVKQNGTGTNVRILGQEITVHGKKASTVIIVLFVLVIFDLAKTGSGWLWPLIKKPQTTELFATEAGDMQTFRTKTEERFTLLEENKNRIGLLEREMTDIKISVTETNGKIDVLSNDNEHIKKGVDETIELMRELIRETKR